MNRYQKIAWFSTAGEAVRVRSKRERSAPADRIL